VPVDVQNRGEDFTVQKVLSYKKDKGGGFGEGDRRNPRRGLRNLLRKKAVTQGRNEGVERKLLMSETTFVEDFVGQELHFRRKGRGMGSDPDDRYKEELTAHGL